MLHPSFSEMMNKINEEGKEPVVKSRYSIVMGTAKRARQMVDKGYMELEDHSRRPLSIAVEELYNGDIRILSEEERAEFEERYAARRAEEAERLAKEAEARAAEEEARRRISLAEDDDDDDEDDEEEAGPEDGKFFEDEKEEGPEEG
ncbi:MAG: DNA-directed RNA polymerase subunit omega [Lachnospiraceae bacterium]|jgi:DNA-directed RNA polymerase subunit omega|nr:DNA-directed RNA polymerase subunit omega [Lachnospiraceae bacterium]